MNIMNKIVRTLLSACGAVVVLFGFSGCLQTDDLVTLDDGVTVSLRLDEAFQEKAYVRLNHDGNQDDYWYWHLTTDLDAAADSLIKAVIAADLEEDGAIKGNVGTNKNITIENLAAKTDYRVLAARILPDGRVIGNVAELVFRTLRDPAVFEEHPQWRVEYKGRKVAEDDPDEETEIFECAIQDTTDTYIPCLLSKDDFEKSYKGDIRTCFEDYVAFRNLANVKWPNVVVSKSIEHVEDRLRHGDYIIFMMGIDAAGELTGYYARQDFSISQEKASAAYLKWIGKWTLTGENGEKKHSYAVEILPDENNLYYRMTGWESTSANSYFAGVPTELPIQLYFEKSTGCAYVISEQLKDLEDAALAEFYDFYLYGCVTLEYDGIMQDVPVDAPNLRLAKFSFINDNMAKATPERFIVDLNGVHYDEEFKLFNYSYISSIYAGLVPVTADSMVPLIKTIRLVR